MKLYEECPSYIEYGHKRYRLDLDFRKVLLVFDLYADPVSYTHLAEGG